MKTALVEEAIKTFQNSAERTKKSMLSTFSKIIEDSPDYKLLTVALTKHLD